jgi:hypothetical protein
MKKSVTVCDHCGNPIHDGWEVVIHRPDRPTSRFEFDYCIECTQTYTLSRLAQATDNPEP